MSEHTNSFPAIHREPGSTQRISASRLRMFLSNLALIGRAESGGFYRGALTDADHIARLKFLEWAKERDFACSYDPMGNLFVRLPGRDVSLSPASNDKTPIEVGTILTIEPNMVYHIEVDGERRRCVLVHEENIAVTDKGVRLLTRRAPQAMPIIQ
jgi:hypothetical protein